jgi:HemY protein
MLRLLIYAMLFVGVTYGALWVSERPGDVLIEWQGYEIQMQLGILLAMAVLATVAVLCVFLMLRSMFLVPKRLRQHNRLRRHEQAIAALNHTMTALALNDHREAERQLNKTRHYLQCDPPVTRLLGVQLAHATGKESNARDAFDAMLEDKTTRPVALRGKIRELMQAGQWVHARDFAQEAFADRPSDHWVAMALLDILFREREWQLIDKTIERAKRSKALTLKQAAHYRSLGLLARAQNAFDAEQYEQALPLAELALKQDTTSLTARLLIAKTYEATSQAKRLQKHLEACWAHQPHPQLASLWLKQFAEEPPAKRHKKLEKLLNRQPEHLESQLLKAQLAMQLSEYESARNALKVALSKADTPRVYALLAELERAEHDDDAKAANWLELALNAPKDFAWTCSNCATTHADWQLHCDSCAQFDSIVWTQPERREGALEKASD